mmetsp:Transcript_2590/g.8327  ORF Transcript_2590/g.8327 Transcript_2590/m.8327 type:complete len:219 (-) Transcript_2590:200-856(-)
MRVVAHHALALSRVRVLPERGRGCQRVERFLRERVDPARLVSEPHVHEKGHALVPFLDVRRSRELARRAVEKAPVERDVLPRERVRHEAACDGTAEAVRLRVRRRRGFFQHDRRRPRRRQVRHRGDQRVHDDAEIVHEVFVLVPVERHRLAALVVDAPHLRPPLRAAPAAESPVAESRFIRVRLLERAEDVRGDVTVEHRARERLERASRRGVRGEPE